MKRGPKSKLDHDPEYRAALGTVPDVEIVARFGVCRSIVIRDRQRLGLKAPRKVYTSTKRTTKVRIDLLGTMTDREIAVISGCTYQRVAHVRADLGIAAVGNSEAARCKREAKIADLRARALGWDDPDVSDAELARRMGVSVSVVNKLRETQSRRPCHAVEEVIALMIDGRVDTARLAEMWPRARGCRKLAGIKCASMVNRGYLRRVAPGVFGVPE